jgi:mannose-1-phosphate guanylyltransferase / mannose-6-phosphate isomerase
MNTAPTIVTPVIMAGGSGTRLWPLSRSGYPKQFLVLSGTLSLFQQAAARLRGLAGDGSHGIMVGAPLIVGNEEHRFLVLDQLRDIQCDPAAALLEPTGRNTAPALTLAALQALAGGADPVLVVTPADQTVTDEAAFAAALRRAVIVAAGGGIAILGVRPDRPETGYGYIRTERVATGEPQVAQFVEKPDAATAARYIADGGYFWNAGLFVLKASTWMAALQRFRPDIASACGASWAARAVDALFVRPGKAEFAAVPSESSWRNARAPTSTSGWSNWLPAGTTSAPGRRSGRCCRRMPTATPASATPSSRTAATRWCTPAAGWCRWWACRTW